MIGQEATKSGTLLPAERHARITASLQSAAVVASADLAAELGVSIETIRRDLAELEERGELVRVHGGAARQRAHLTSEPSFDERAISHQDAKTRIGRAAARLVEPNSTIIIDVGTTALAIVHALPADFTGTVVTCSLPAAVALAEHSSAEVVMCGGTLRRGDLAISGVLAREFFATLHADIAFLGSGGIALDGGLSDFYLDEAAVRREMLRNSARSYALADSSKFNRVGRFSVAALSDITGVITERHPGEDMARGLADLGCDLWVAD